MDCQAFDTSLLDALYDELDASTSAAMDEHAASCDACSARYARLTKTQDRVRPVLGALETPLPDGLEAKILAAAEAAMDRAAAGAQVVSLSDRRPRSEDEKRAASESASKTGVVGQPPARSGVVAFLSRPQFAIAATFVLVLGAAALLINTSKKSDAPEAASMAAQQSPAASAIAAATPPAATFDQGGLTPPSDFAAASAAPTATLAPMGSLALADPSTPPDLARESAEDKRHAGRPSLRTGPPAAPAPAPPPPAKLKAAKAEDDDRANHNGPSGGGGAKAPSSTTNNANGDPAFVAAKSLYDSGRYAEALPKFQALAASNIDAELYVARCLSHTKSCDAAAPHYDNVAKRGVGTLTGSTAGIEAARCYKNSNQVADAKKRYERLKTDNHYSGEANAEFHALDQPKAAKPSVHATSTGSAHPPPAAVDNAAAH